MILIDKEKCDFCGTCVAVCDPDAIDLFHRDILVNHEKCIECLRCVTVCPAGAATHRKEGNAKEGAPSNEPRS